MSIIDAQLLDAGTRFYSDVCVVGAGAAGVPLALGLARAGLDVALLESGGLEHEPAIDRLNEAQNSDPRYPLARSRVRHFGGATNHWGGLCHALEADDFEARSWIPASGWPFPRRDLDPYYARALPILDLPRLYGPRELDAGARDTPFLLGTENPMFAAVVWLKSAPTRIGAKYREEIVQSNRVRCFLHATGMRLLPAREGGHVKGLEAGTLNGRRMRFTARCYVLATGGIENARLLLLSDSLRPGGLGNQHDLVGRYFMDHLNQVVGTMIVALPAGALPYRELAPRRVPGVQPGLWGFMTTPAFRAERRLLACVLNATPDARVDDAAAGVTELLIDPSGTLPPERRGSARRYTLTAFAEQAPNPASRVFLIGERDALGCRKVGVDLRYTADDTRSVTESLRSFVLELGRGGRARVQVGANVGSVGWHILAGHHMGTTRMANDPRHGVTDGHGRVHGIANLYLAGSSLFPTTGFASPTLTIVALALRQVDHLIEATRKRS